jgi:hypothetical protein
MRKIELLKLNKGKMENLNEREKVTELSQSRKALDVTQENVLNKARNETISNKNLRI